MARTCRMCHGSSDGYKETNLMRCARCKNVYYCSTACQRRDWASHKLDCKSHQPQISTTDDLARAVYNDLLPAHPQTYHKPDCKSHQPQINTADDLARAVYNDLFPEHPQTCEDYGFNRAVTPEEKANLLGLYIGLIKIRGIPPKTIHDWRVRGILVDEIKATFYNDSRYTWGAYFPWFLQNEHIVALAGKPLSTRELRDHGDAMMTRTWRFTGGSEGNSVEEIRAAIACKPADEQECYSLYTFLLCKWTPSPDLDLWIAFGFASCISEGDEGLLNFYYRRLITMCTFEEFCDAYRNRRLLDLFRSKGMELYSLNIGHLQDLLCGPADQKKSVWYLKQFVVREGSPGEESGPLPSVMVDYGFMNCRNASERQQLKNVYKAFFDEHHHGDPLALHEAAIKGNIYGFLSSKLHGLSDPKFRRFMKNPYPLPSF